MKSAIAHKLDSIDLEQWKDGKKVSLDYLPSILKNACKDGENKEVGKIDIEQKEEDNKNIKSRQQNGDMEEEMELGIQEEKEKEEIDQMRCSSLY